MFDIHFHWLPGDLLERARQASPKNLMLRPPYEKIEDSVRVMDASGIEMSLITYVFFEPLVRGFLGSRAEAFRSINEQAAEIRLRYPGRFLHCAAVDAMAGEEAAPELERAISEYGCSALQMMTCFPDGDDTIFPHERRFWPLYRKAEELGVPVFMHPVRPPFWTKLPATVQFMVGDWGFLLGDQLAMHLMACGGVFEAFPKLQFIFCQLGGFVPFTLGRTDLGYEMHKVLPTRETGSPDLELVRMRDFNGRYYVDCHSADSTAIRCAAANYGSDKLLFSTDFPVTPVEMGVRWHVEQIKGAGLGDEAVRGITSENARRLLNLK